MPVTGLRPASPARRGTSEASSGRPIPCTKGAGQASSAGPGERGVSGQSPALGWGMGHRLSQEEKSPQQQREVSLWPRLCASFRVRARVCVSVERLPPESVAVSQ